MSVITSCSSRFAKVYAEDQGKILCSVSPEQEKNLVHLRLRECAGEAPGHQPLIWKRKLTIPRRPFGAPPWVR